MSDSESKETTVIPKDRPVGAVAAALAKAQGDFPVIEKKREAKVLMKSGGTYTYRYADLSDIMSAIKGPLSKNGLSILQAVEGDSLVTRLFHSSGEHLRSEVPMVWPTDEKATPQAMGSALTYSRRYGVCLALGIAAEEDDDATDAQDSSNKGAPKGQGTKQTATPISAAQAKRLFAISGKAGWSPADVQDLIAVYGYQKSADIKWTDYKTICDWIEHNPIGPEHEGPVPLPKKA